MIATWKKWAVSGWMIAVAGTALAAPSAEACSCKPFGETPTKHEFADAEAVFLGQLVSAELVPGHEPGTQERVMKWQVYQLFKGNRFIEYVETSGRTRALIEIRTRVGMGSCEMPFEMDSTHLIWAYYNKATRSLSTGLCTRTVPYPSEQAERDLAWLDLWINI